MIGIAVRVDLYGEQGEHLAGRLSNSTIRPEANAAVEMQTLNHNIP